MNALTEREHPSQLPHGVLRVRSNGKRIYADEFKAELVRQCLVPETSVAATGMAHGVNANLLRRWIVLHGARDRDVASAPVLLLGGRVQGGLHGPAPDLEQLEDDDVPFAVDFRSIYGAIERDWMGLESSSALAPISVVRV